MAGTPARAKNCMFGPWEDEFACGILHLDLYPMSFPVSRIKSRNLIGSRPARPLSLSMCALIRPPISLAISHLYGVFLSFDFFLVSYLPSAHALSLYACPSLCLVPPSPNLASDAASCVAPCFPFCFIDLFWWYLTTINLKTLHISSVVTHRFRSISFRRSCRIPSFANDWNSIFPFQ